MNRPFLPRTYVDRKNRELKKSAYKKSTVSFSIQNRFIIQANFLSTEPGMKNCENKWSALF